MTPSFLSLAPLSLSLSLFSLSIFNHQTVQHTEVHKKAMEIQAVFPTTGQSCIIPVDSDDTVSNLIRHVHDALFGTMTSPGAAPARPIQLHIDNEERTALDDEEELVASTGLASGGVVLASRVHAVLHEARLRAGCHGSFVTVSPSGRRCAVLAKHGQVEVWDLVQGTCTHPSLCLGTQSVYSPDIAAVAFVSEDTVAVPSKEKILLITLPEDGGRDTKVLSIGHRGVVTHIATSGCGRYAVSACSYALALVWDAVSGVVTHKVSLHDPAAMLCLSPNAGHFCYASASDTTATIVNLDTLGADTFAVKSGGNKVTKCKAHIGRVLCMDASKCGTVLITGGDDTRVHIWGLGEGEGERSAPRASLRAHGGAVRNVRCSPCSRWALSASVDMTMMRFDIASAAPLQTVRLMHCTSLAVSPCSRWLIWVLGKDLSVRASA